MHRTQLPECGGEHLFDRTFQTLIAILRHILDPMYAAFLQLRQKRGPTGFAFLIGQLHRQHMALTFEVNADCDLHRAGAYRTVILLLISHIRWFGARALLGRRVRFYELLFDRLRSDV